MNDTITCHCGAPAIDCGNGMEDICEPCFTAWQAAGEPESCPCVKRIDWDGRLGTVVSELRDGGASVRWDDGDWDSYTGRELRSAVRIEYHEVRKGVRA